MGLEKFKFLNNRYLHDRRLKERVDTLNRLQNTETRKKQVCKLQSKYKYVSRLLLYNSQLKNASKISYDKCDNVLSGAELLTCNPDWPLCLYDHTYKCRCISYFSFKSNGPCEFLDDYFDSEKGRSGEKPKAGAESLPLTAVNLKKKDLKTYNSLVVERNRHYCTNAEFVTKVNKMLEEHGSTEAAFPTKLVEPSTADELSLFNVMENYVNHIMSYSEEMGFEGGEREVNLGTGYDEGEEEKEIEEEEKRPRVHSEDDEKPKFGSPKTPTPDMEEIKARREKRNTLLNRTITSGCNEKLMENMAGFYSRRAIPMSFYLAEMASKAPAENSDDIFIRSSAGKLLGSIMEPQSQVNI